MTPKEELMSVTVFVVLFLIVLGLAGLFALGLAVCGVARLYATVLINLTALFRLLVGRSGTSRADDSTDNHEGS